MWPLISNIDNLKKSKLPLADSEIMSYQFGKKKKTIKTQRHYKQERSDKSREFELKTFGEYNSLSCDTYPKPQ